MSNGTLHGANMTWSVQYIFWKRANTTIPCCTLHVAHCTFHIALYRQYVRGAVYWSSLPYRTALSYGTLHTAYCIPHIACCILPTAYCILHTAYFDVLHVAYCIPVLHIAYSYWMFHGAKKRFRTAESAKTRFYTNRRNKKFEVEPLYLCTFWCYSLLHTFKNVGFDVVIAHSRSGGISCCPRRTQQLL